MRTLIILVFLLITFGIIMPTGQSQEDFERFSDLWQNTDFSKASVSADEIRSGGVPRDGIPPYYPENYRYPASVQDPLGGREPAYTIQYTDIATTNSYLPDEQSVIAVEINGEARAYPLLLLNNHEIANTEIAGIPIVVTFCPLCNASIVYERTVEGQVFHFGVSGLLRNSDLIMWDHETESWWQQFTGEAIVGTYTGAELVDVPSLVVSWGEFKTQYPDALVLANQSNRRVETVSYQGYDQSDNAFLYDGVVDPRLPTLSRVLGYFGPEGAVAYPFSELQNAGMINDVIGGEPVVIMWQPGADSLFSPDFEVGSAALYSAILPDGRTLTFSTRDDKVITDDQTGSTWNIFGRATSGELAETQLDRYFAYPHFWFAWAAFRPDTLVWEPGMITDEAW